MALYNSSRGLGRVRDWHASRWPLMCLSQVKASWRASSVVACWRAGGRGRDWPCCRWWRRSPLLCIGEADYFSFVRARAGSCADRDVRRLDIGGRFWALRLRYADKTKTRFVGRWSKALYVKRGAGVIRFGVV